MTGIDEEKINVDDLLKDTASVRAALLISDSFLRKMDETLVKFIESVQKTLSSNSQYEIFTEAYGVNAVPGLTVVIERVKDKKNIFDFVLALEMDHDSLYACLGFVREVGKNRTEWIPLSDMEMHLPEFYHKWMKKVKSLHLQNMKQNKVTTWFSVENTRGQVLDFYNYSQSVLELVDEMDVQSAYVAENMITQVLDPLSN